MRGSCPLLLELLGMLRSTHQGSRLLRLQASALERRLSLQRMLHLLLCSQMPLLERLLLLLLPPAKLLLLQGMALHSLRGRSLLLLLLQLGSLMLLLLQQRLSLLFLSSNQLLLLQLALLLPELRHLNSILLPRR